VRRRRAAVAAAAVLLVALNGCTGSAASSDAKKPSTSGSVATVDPLGVEAKLSAAIDSAMSDKDG
jgi:PBP1b-binding outer membrane lipoprotein LpoB